MRTLGGGIHAMALELRARHRRRRRACAAQRRHTHGRVPRATATAPKRSGSHPKTLATVLSTTSSARASRAARPSARRSGTRRPNPPMELTNHHRCDPPASNEASKPSDAAVNAAAARLPHQRNIAAIKAAAQTHRQSHPQRPPSDRRAAQSPASTAPPAHARPQQDAPHARRPLQPRTLLAVARPRGTIPYIKPNQDQPTQVEKTSAQAASSGPAFVRTPEQNHP